MDYFKTFVEEKGVDPQETFDVLSPDGTPNYNMSYGVVMDAISRAPAHEKHGIERKLRTLPIRLSPKVSE